ncbi:GNAT family N-acetyltransferase [Kitasatospora sp. NPDC057541]|uniref:GNAT family N-acetyltransferase n=1 Tax=unclassified Kitasatospora TaxID=2633591 RepID=UPI0036878597
MAITTTSTPEWSLRPGRSADVEPIAELRAEVMRADLVRLGRYDEHRVRRRLRETFSTRYTRVVEVDGALAGCVTVRPDGPTAEPGEPAEPGARLLEHFYLAAAHQGRGLGTAVLRHVLAEADAARAAVRLVVLQGSAARRLYERHGFTVEGQDPVDVFMVRPAAGRPGGPGR